MLRITNLTLRRGHKVLLEQASLTVFPGHKLGLVGSNGCGKSSLFSLLRRELPRSYLDHPATQRAVGEELVDRLADLHAFDWKHSAIAELARPEGFLARQVERWMSQLSQYRTRELPGIDDVAQ